MNSLYEEIFKLKTTIRKGWLETNASALKSGGRVESDAEHVFSMAVLALEVMEKENLKLDRFKVLKMILFHEFGEIDNGDHTFNEGISKEEKYAKELKCVKRISEEHGMPEILELWVEAEARQTPEAKFVRQMDKLDCVLQSKIYSEIKQDDNKIFNEFFTHWESEIKELKKYISKS